MATSYHIHTRWSDGRGEFEDYVAAAIAAGLEEIGFSDHWALTASGDTPWWSMAPDGLDDYLDAIGDVISALKYRNAGEGGGLIVRAGIEADFVPERIADIRAALDGRPFDYVIGSIHFVGDFVVDASPSPWEAFTAEEIDRLFISYYRLVRQMAETQLFDIVGHFDVLRKFGFAASCDLATVISEALDSIKEAGTALELNTSGRHTPSGQAYPEPWILRECLRRSIPVLITADAHESGSIRRDFDTAETMLAEIGFRQTVRFEKRRAIPEELGTRQFPNSSKCV
ncbi:MAG: histidinol-phosphatase [Armatimonadota bacterium]|nr:histidinol-phosphatase [Armatimonadota bacterium]